MFSKNDMCREAGEKIVLFFSSIMNNPRLRKGYKVNDKCDGEYMTFSIDNRKSHYGSKRHKVQENYFAIRLNPYGLVQVKQGFGRAKWSSILDKDAVKNWRKRLESCVLHTPESRYEQKVKYQTSQEKRTASAIRVNHMLMGLL